jgi:hypothetical protein
MFAEALAEIKPKDEDQIVPNLEDAARPLKNVVVFVNKKLVRIQAELHTIVTDLGGSYQWTLEPGCTHYIYQGKKGDVSKIKEPRQAKRDKCHIVSPQWIYSVSEDILVEYYLSCIVVCTCIMSTEMRDCSGCMWNFLLGPDWKRFSI